VILSSPDLSEAYEVTVKLADWLDRVGHHGLIDPVTGEVMVADATQMGYLLRLMIPSNVLGSA
jgi:hypothetical protein